MIRLKWTDAITIAWWKITAGLIDSKDWAEMHNARYCMFNGHEYLEFKEEADAIIFKLKIGV